MGEKKDKGSGIKVKQEWENKEAGIPTRVDRGQEAGTRSLKKAGKTSNPFGERGDE